MDYPLLVGFTRCFPFPFGINKYSMATSLYREICKFFEALQLATSLGRIHKRVNPSLALVCLCIYCFIAFLLFYIIYDHILFFFFFVFFFFFFLLYFFFFFLFFY